MDLQSLDPFLFCTYSGGKLHEKDYFFIFSPSVRFLGLSLKILFHKNKEIKRMLSKKMTFSLMSLNNNFRTCFRVYAFAMSADITVEVKLVAGTNVYSSA